MLGAVHALIASLDPEIAFVMRRESSVALQLTRRPKLDTKEWSAGPGARDTIRTRFGQVGAVAAA
jgi:hypothetical protein